MIPHQTTENGCSYDRDGVLKDGETLRAPLLLMDAAMQETADQARKAFADADDGIMHKPGQVRSNINDALAATKEVLRDERKTMMANAWKHPRAANIVADSKVAPTTDLEAFHERRNARIADAWRGAA
jgi:hypothetical protein